MPLDLHNSDGLDLPLTGSHRLGLAGRRRSIDGGGGDLVVVREVPPAVLGLEEEVYGLVSVTAKMCAWSV
jgi:hypothetical protein